MFLVQARLGNLSRRLSAFLPEIQASTRERSSKNFDLHSVSPILFHAVNMELAVPGRYFRMYLPEGTVITISSFKHDIPTIKTKQRPRRLFLLGSNGQQFVYLLKGREDLRQDERVISLVNTLLARDRESLKRRLHLQRYTVIPLAPDVDLEHKMIRDGPDYDQPQAILLSRKLQVFQSAMNRTTGQDLYRILWLKSDSSEAWVTRRTATLLQQYHDRRKYGKVIHIDFGDCQCFEVSFERDSLPEKVPFRLARMLRHAMEVCGIQGGFKTSCEISMVVLRDNKESFGYPGGANATAEGTNREVRNERALAVYSRIEDKLTGRDFGSDHILTVTAQVEKLVQQAISNENICQHFYGWCPFW
ncbi:kinase-like protein [Ramaria rubella]|nr:kinase-like protein [Ramaria rubella]